MTNHSCIMSFNKIDGFFEDFKKDLLKSKYIFNNEFLSLNDRISENEIRIHQIVNYSQIDQNFPESHFFKVFKVKMDLSCVFENDSMFVDVLDNIFLDFERTFFARSENEGEDLSKRVLISRNGIKISVYVDFEEELNVFLKEQN